MPGLKYDIAIIGAGFTGTALTVELLERVGHRARILLVGSPQATGRGLAYGTDHSDHLVNVTAERLSVRPDDPDHFLRWLAKREGGAADADVGARYVPRHLYGSYLRETLRRARGASDSCVEMKEGRVEEILRIGGDLGIRMASGERFAASFVVLCLGHGPGRLPVPPEALEDAAKPRIIQEPYSDLRMGQIGSHERVLLVGTGLTMVDQALLLSKSGRTAPIDAISRRGRVPMSHGDATVIGSAPIAIPQTRSLASLFRETVRDARHEIAAGRDWRPIVDGLRQKTQSIWRQFSVADRRRFLRHVLPIWSIHRHRMAPAVARRLSELRSDRLLNVRAARILSIRKAKSGVVVALQDRAEKTVSPAPYDWVVNCTGPGVVGGPLVNQMVAAGLARFDPLERGLDVAEDGAIVQGDGVPAADIFAAGPPTFGTWLEITAVREIREQCARLADLLASKLDREDNRRMSRKAADTHS